MKLKIDLIDHEIKIENDSINVIEIENPKLFSNIVEAIVKYSKKEDSECNVFLYDDNQKPIKDIDIVFNPFLIDLNSKKISTAILNRLKKIIATNCIFADTMQNHLLSIEKVISDEMIDCTIPMIFDENLDAQRVVKMSGLQIDSTYMDLMTLIMKYIDVASEFKFTEIIFFLNLKSYLDIDDYNKLCKFILQKQVPVLLLEQTISGYPSPDIYQSILYIDNEFDEFLITPKRSFFID